MTRHPLQAIHTHAFDFWLARGSVVAIIALQLLIVSGLSVGPNWLAPVLELALLIPLSLATAWTQGKVQSATSDAHWHHIARLRRAVRRLAVVLTAIITELNSGGLYLC